MFGIVHLGICRKWIADKICGGEVLRAAMDSSYVRSTLANVLVQANRLLLRLLVNHMRSVFGTCTAHQLSPAVNSWRAVACL